MTSLVPNFKQVAEELALNEACAYQERPPVSCVFGSPCPECRALGKAIERRLVEMFMLGQKSMAGAIPVDGEIIEALEVEDEA